MSVTNEVIARMPWLYAEGESWWIVTGFGRDGHRIEECIAQVVPAFITGVDDGDGFALFRVFVHTNSPLLVSADRITRAKRLIFVMADQPDRAYYEDEQEFIDAERGVA